MPLAPEPRRAVAVGARPAGGVAIMALPGVRKPKPKKPGNGAGGKKRARDVGDDTAEGQPSLKRRFAVIARRAAALHGFREADFKDDDLSEAAEQQSQVLTKLLGASAEMDNDSTVTVQQASLAAQLVGHELLLGVARSLQKVAPVLEKLSTMVAVVQEGMEQRANCGRSFLATHESEVRFISLLLLLSRALLLLWSNLCRFRYFWLLCRSWGTDRRYLQGSREGVAQCRVLDGLGEGNGPAPPVSRARCRPQERRRRRQCQ
jgi:hypothetical protein